uniref:Protein RIK n=1 Tax=Oryza barthii TaxID=65489 RepID=A0A0D3FFE9_9ORYZ
MTEDRAPKVPDEPAAAAAKQRKKRKWDQPAEDVVAAAAAAAAVAGLPVVNIGALSGVSIPGAAGPLGNIVAVPYTLPVHLAPSVLQTAAAAVQKLSQAKMPDELIAREIVINDTDPSVRYKLTKRQTQEEIQRCTSTVIITRGRYHPPNGQTDGEKPLYLHISAGSQLKDTAERIKAVDRAASMIEEILKQGPNPEGTIQSNGQIHHLTLQLGFVVQIPVLFTRGKEKKTNLEAFSGIPIGMGETVFVLLDQYINHIMNETGVTVVLRGKGSGTPVNCHAEASQQPLHLYISSMHVKNLEAAKVLAENLLDTIAAEFGASRISSSKVYGAVPPPQQLLDVTSQSGAPSYSVVPPPSNLICPSQPANGGTFYGGYGGIYPQATPLQQVALTLKHASSSSTQVVSATSTSTSTVAMVNPCSHAEADKRSQRRKFQELPVSQGATTEVQVFSLTLSEAHRVNSQQRSKFVKTGLDGLGNMTNSSIEPPIKVQPGSNGMLLQDQPHVSAHPSASKNMLPPPPPPPRNMLPPPPKSMPPPPPKFPSNEMSRNEDRCADLNKPMAPPKSMPPPPPKSMPPPPPKFPSNEMSRNEDRRSDLNKPMAPPRSLDVSSVSPPNLYSAQLPSKEPRVVKPGGASVSDTLLKLMDYGDDDEEDNIDETNSVLGGNPTSISGQKPFWAV